MAQCLVFLNGIKGSVTVGSDRSPLGCCCRGVKVIGSATKKTQNFIDGFDFNVTESRVVRDSSKKKALEAIGLNFEWWIVDEENKIAYTETQFEKPTFPRGSKHVIYNVKVTNIIAPDLKGYNPGNTYILIEALQDLIRDDTKNDTKNSKKNIILDSGEVDGTVVRLIREKAGSISKDMGGPGTKMFKVVCDIEKQGCRERGVPFSASQFAATCRPEGFGTVPVVGGDLTAVSIEGVSSTITGRSGDGGGNNPAASGGGNPNARGSIEGGFYNPFSK